jgi:hypothetical protein
MQIVSYICLILNKLEISGEILIKVPNTIFHENLSSWSRIVACGWTEERKNMKKLILAFCNFTKAPRNKIEAEISEKILTTGTQRTIPRKKKTSDCF